jgi:hypothetical protein
MELIVLLEPEFGDKDGDWNCEVPLFLLLEDE